MKRPSRSAFVTAGLGFAVALSSCTGPVDSPPPQPSTSTTSPTASTPSPTASPSSSPAPDDGGSSAALTTFSGSWLDVQYSFDHPSDWTILDSAADDRRGAGVVSILGPDANQLASFVILLTWGASCALDGCTERPAVYLGDWAGGTPLSGSGPFVVRSMAMDLAEFPQDRSLYGWRGNVQLSTSLTSNPASPPATLAPGLMHGLGQVEAGAATASPDTQRTVYFAATRDFETLRDARAYAASDEHRQIQAMIASFRER